MGDYEKALLGSQKALRILEQALVFNHVSVAMTKENIGYVYEQLNDIAQARTCIEEAYSIFVQSPGPAHPRWTGIAQVQ